MAALTKDELLVKLQAAGVDYQAHEHAAAMTTDEQERLLAGVAGAVTKNLFLKDKKHRVYVITALSSTVVDLKILGARLGVGKTNLSMAAKELFEPVLQVPLGSVTPLVVANPGASEVVLLLDRKLRDQAILFVHPLVNTCSLALTPAHLDAALRLCGRDPVYVDLEIEPKIDQHNPPDLKHIADAATAPAAAVPAKAESSIAVAAEASTSTATAAAAGSASRAFAQSQPTTSGSAPATVKGNTAAKVTGGKGGKAAGSGKSSEAAVLQQLTDVSLRAEEILNLVSGALLGDPHKAAELPPYTAARLRADLETSLNALKNAAYSSGYVAGKGEIVAFAERRYA